MPFWTCRSPCPGLGQLLISGITTVMHRWVLALRPEGSTSCRPRGESGFLCPCTLPPWAVLAGLVHAGPLGSLRVNSAPKLG